MTTRKVLVTRAILRQDPLLSKMRDGRVALTEEKNPPALLDPPVGQVLFPIRLQQLEWRQVQWHMKRPGQHPRTLQTQRLGQRNKPEGPQSPGSRIPMTIFRQT